MPASPGCDSAAPPSSPQGRLEIEFQLQQVLQIYLSNVVDDVPGGEACQGANGFMTGCACCPQEGRMLGAARTPETAGMHVGRPAGPSAALAETTEGTTPVRPVPGQSRTSPGADQPQEGTRQPRDCPS